MRVGDVVEERVPMERDKLIVSVTLDVAVRVAAGVSDHECVPIRLTLDVGVVVPVFVKLTVFVEDTVVSWVRVAVKLRDAVTEFERLAVHMALRDPVTLADDVMEGFAVFVTLALLEAVTDSVRDWESEPVSDIV